MRRIQDNSPGSVLYERENFLTCIICLSKDPAAARLKTWLRDLARQMRAEHSVRLSIGIGNQCQNIGDYRRAIHDAHAAPQNGPKLNRTGGVTHLHHLGVLRSPY